MYYDDEARRFNFLSGLLLGAVLGTGLGLLAGPARRKKVVKQGSRLPGRTKAALAKRGMRRPREGAGARIMGDLARRRR